MGEGGTTPAYDTVVLIDQAVAQMPRCNIKASSTQTNRRQVIYFILGEQNIYSDFVSHMSYGTWESPYITSEHIMKTT